MDVNAKVPASLNLTQKLAEIRKMTEAIAKNKSGYNYKYVSVDELLAKVTAGMKKYRISLYPSIREDSAGYQNWHYEKVKFTKSGERYLEPNDEVVFSAQMVYTWVNDDDPNDRLSVPWFAMGCQPDPAQALGTGLSYALRQFLMNFFQIAALDGEDPDAWKAKQKAAEEAEDRAVAEQIIDQVHALVTSHLESNPDDRPKIVAITKKYAKEKGKPSTNYYAITSSEVASNLLTELKETFKED